jgi:glyoxylase-like metal-dependent hydrolase (beta-lactamase superfamily II)
VRSGGNPFAPRAYGQLVQASDRVWVFRNITNSTFVVGDRSVAVIDTQVNRPTAELLGRAIRSVTPKPVSHVVNTHYHWDHTNGNALFAGEGAAVVASKLTLEFMVTRRERQKAFLEGRGFQLNEDPMLPAETFEGETAIDLGGCALRLFHAGRAESDDATAIHIPSEGVVLAGDTVMTGSFPIFGQPVWDEGLQGDGAWQETVRRLAALGASCIVPGHGPLAGPAEVARLLEIEDFFVEEVRKLVERGFDAPGVLADLGPRLPGWMKDMPVVWGTPAYAALRVFRGLTRKPDDGENGWWFLRPSPIPSAGAGRTAERLKGRESLAEYLESSREAAEGGDDGLAIDVLDAATAAFPREPDAWAAYAEALIEASRRESSVLEKGDFFDRARRAWRRARALNPEHPKSLIGEGRYLVMMAYRGGDDPEPGMRLLRRVLEQEVPDGLRAEAEFYLGMGHRRLGDEPQAQAQFQKALRLNPAFMPARLALEA